MKAAGFLFVLLLSVEPSSAQVTQATLEGLRSSDMSVHYRALLDATKAPPGALDTATVEFLDAELSRLTDTLSAHQSQPDQFRALNEQQTEFRALLAEVLSGQQNPISIDALVGTIDTLVPFGALVRFGEPAVPSLVRAAGSDAGVLRHVHACLDALEQMLERPAIRSTLTPASLALVRQVAAARMANPGHDRTILASAAYLAIATGDPELRRLAEDIPDNMVAFQSRGISRPNDLLFVSERIRQALAKFPPQP